MPQDESGQRSSTLMALILDFPEQDQKMGLLAVLLLTQNDLLLPLAGLEYFIRLILKAVY